MNRLLFICLFAVSFILCCNMAYAEDLYVVATKKTNFAPVAKTGQKTSYDTADDGALQKGIAWPNPRFTDNGDGTVTDNLSELVWLKRADYKNTAGGTGSTTWVQALLFCNFLQSGQCGLSDGSSEGEWRLPNINELLTLVDYGYYGPALSNADGTGKWSSENAFTNVQSQFYWVSTSATYNTSKSFEVNLIDGYMFFYDKTAARYVWPVRDKQ